MQLISPHQKELADEPHEHQKYHLYELYKTIDINQLRSDQQIDLLSIQYWIDTMFLQIECLFDQVKPELVLEIEIDNVMTLFGIVCNVDRQSS